MDQDRNLVGQAIVQDQLIPTVISEYNTQHHHSALEGHTPATVHDGSWTHVHDQRQATLTHSLQPIPTATDASPA